MRCSDHKFANDPRISAHPRCVHSDSHGRERRWPREQNMLKSSLNIDVGTRAQLLSPDASGRRIETTYDLMQHRLGKGHFSEVRLALRRESNVRVAVKVMQKRDASRIARIHSEVEILRQASRLQHPNLVRLLDYFEGDNEAFIVLEYLSDGSLLDLLRKEGAIAEGDARSIVRQITSGLKAVHVSRRRCCCRCSCCCCCFVCCYYYYFAASMLAAA